MIFGHGTTKDVVYFLLNLLTECLFIDRNQIQDWLDERVESSDTEGAKRRWKLFWKVKVQSKIHIFAWRLAHNSFNNW